jgi:hypothetical protein
MSFRQPAVLWFALLLLAPLVLYLLAMPRRRVAASALYLWQRFLASERYGRTSERFRRALGLALLAAILLSLVLAAADPTLGTAPTRAGSVVVVLDVSASMNAVVGGVTNLSRAKEAAAQLIESLDAGTAVAAALAGGEGAGDLDVIHPMGPAGREAAATIRAVTPFEGPGDLRAALAKAWALWGQGGRGDVELFVFTDQELPQGPWRPAARAWLAPAVGGMGVSPMGPTGVPPVVPKTGSMGETPMPPTGETPVPQPEGNAGIVDIAAQRQPGRQIAVTFTVANYGRSPRDLTGTVLANGQVRGQFHSVAVATGQTARHHVQFEEPAAATIQAALAGPHDALPADDTAWARVPALDDLRVGVVWPEGNRRNDYVAAVLSALQAEGLVGPVVESTPPTTAPATGPESEGGTGGTPVPPPLPAPATPVTVYVNQLPAAWPAAGGAIVLYPLRGGAIELAGLHSGTVTVARQAQHDLLAGVDLRGLAVKGAVQAPVPPWATPLVWAEDNLPLVWAGQTGATRVLFVGIPVMPSGSRLPLVASFPALMRNAVQWMLPGAETLRPGDRVNGWTSPRAGLVAGPDGTPHAFSLANPRESDLRRPSERMTQPLPQRRSLAGVFVLLAAVLLPVEWGLFHKRLTE